jgi:two-component system, NarL family, nitrate/nitrite response regulator NarL
MNRPPPLSYHNSPSDVCARPNIDVVLAESYPMLLAGMEYLIASHEDLRVVARCTTGEQALRAVRQHQPDVLVSDLLLPDKSGLAVLRDLTGELKQTRVILLADRIQQDEMVEAVRLGAKGVILKEMPDATLVRCIRKVHAGGTWLETQAMAGAMDTLLRRDAGAKEVAQLLTPRELQVLRDVATGLRNKNIGARLGIAEGTVKIHLHNIYEKLNIKGRLELILFARDRGWV